MKNRKIFKVLLVIIMVITLSGCTQILKNEEGKPVKNPETGQTITENIICKPKNKTSIKLYKENKVNIEKLPECNKLKITGDYEGIWNTFFVRPLGYMIVKIAQIVKSSAVSIIIITLIIRGFLFPLTKNSMLQSQNMKKAKPEIDRIEKKYEGKNDQESAQKKGQEMMLVYKKYGIKPLSGCLFAFIQIPILFAFYEAITKIPSIFEESFLGLKMGSTPLVALQNGMWYYIIVCIILIIVTYVSYKMNPSMATNDKMEKQQKTMTKFMTIFIGFISFTLPIAIAFYWITTSVFTIIQNYAIGRRIKTNE